ncbi:MULTISPECIES: Acg family FMN-binding oxidoreductase [Pseudonocardia]|jgi:nitroreductase|uniref:Nitroreductase n=1 Tax=Pseudonocardia dioxanivorans (strain ATCC 55486 / DSM 44775 / JCM 13855 / CB1190) TaxID=675635 RepID=F4CKK5_PSEUX|nr:nitroreductase family protein [Pseudonocardia dioxanivorans]AEA22975.1 nitroreductase [Pseudonocardia dioxanivorans CB1190]GJF04939.1 NAD(P)H nitroreductase [Pseudonocardia sp. D17]
MLDTRDAATVRAAVGLACMAPSVHNSQPWRWLVGPASLHLHADLGRWLQVTDPDGRDLVMSCGAALHHLRVALVAAGRHAVVHRLPNPADGDHLAAVELRADGRPDTETDIGLASAIPVRRSDRRRFSTWPVPPAFLDELVAAAAANGARLTPVEPADHAAVLRAIRDAGLAQQSLPGYSTELAMWSGGLVGPDGVPAANLPADPGAAGPAVRHFTPGVLEERYPDVDDGAQLLIIATSSDDPLSWLRAGEALSAVSLRAVVQGLASCPLSTPMEVTRTRLALRDDVLGGTSVPQLVLRVGWPPSGELPRTPRRPVSDVLTTVED